jgi:hypothetical protein
MGAFADAMARFAQPLLDATDGSPEQVQRAFMLSQLCWNLAVTPEAQRDELLAGMQPAMKMDDEAFQDLKQNVVMPMIRRHQEMFPGMQRSGAGAPSHSMPSQVIPPPAKRRPVKKFAGTGRNEPCPCGSGRKYKLCCGR